MLHEKHAEWLKARGISPSLAEEMGLFTTSGAGGNWLTVPYTERGRVVNHKYRLTSEKQHRMDAGAPLCLWNHDLLLDDRLSQPDWPVIITEGEWDALAAIQAGLGCVLSVPNGASGEATKGEIDPEADASRFSYLWRARDLLDRVAKFILATDGDDPGRVLAAELARRLGPERCKFITYPEGCKDLNDVLLAHGETGVRDVIGAAKPYPVKGLYRMNDFPEPSPVRSLPLGIPGLAERLPVVPGTLTVLTGFAGAGKTTLTMVMLAALMRNGYAVGVGSFETATKPVMQRKLQAAILECAESSLHLADVDHANRIIEDRLVIISNSVDDEADEIDLDYLLELGRIAVIRDGIRLLLIDPWNELEHKRGRDEGDHDYTGRALRAIKAFARQYQVAVWVVVHPRKPELAGTKLRMPTLYDASGSAHWANKADYGLVVWRPDPERTEIEAHVTKVRMGLPGKYGATTLAFDWRYTRYVEAARVLE